MAQKRNPQNEELLSAHMARRDEPNFALGNAISTYLALPALRGFWPTGAHHVTTQSWYLDDIACDYDVSAYGSPGLGFSNLYPWIYLDGDECFYYLDNAQFDITGIDPPTAVANRGLTLGAWVKFDNTGNTETIMSKYNGAIPQRSYILLKDINEKIVIRISLDGGTVNMDINTSVNAVTANVWHFVVGRWNTTNISTFIDGIVHSTASAQASIFNSDTWFVVGADAQPADYMTGYQSFVFICAASVSDSIIKNIWHQTRYLFNK